MEKIELYTHIHRSVSQTGEVSQCQYPGCDYTIVLENMTIAGIWAMFTEVSLWTVSYMCIYNDLNQTFH